MIEIVYSVNNEHIFKLVYELHEYIPKLIFDKYKEYPELHFIQDLFASDSSIQFVNKFTMIWSLHYEFKYIDKGFTIVLDEDYDLISFVVDNPKNKSEIAKYICNLIENQKVKSE